ncbi:hypothetical protein ACJRO7_015177 [Eucalyptus globulus]|uniref:Uncharacterized protein n=1 Tax=Eucalyptus globulus TaxID=34317 RepID=A0ABD3L3C5_EUCGL
MTRSIAERVVEAIKHEQVRDETKPKQDRYDLGRFGISNGRSSKMRVWRNSDGGPPSWTVRLEGPGRRASVLDRPYIAPGCLPGGKLAVSPESLNSARRMRKRQPSLPAR